MRCDSLVKGTEFQAETLPATQAKGAVKKASAKVVGDARLQAEEGRQSGRQAAERGRRAEERDPQGLRESFGKAGTRRTGHVWVVACLGVARGPAARSVNVHPTRPAWAESPDDGPSLWWVSSESHRPCSAPSYSSC
jgi:hypothetical protein